MRKHEARDPKSDINLGTLLPPAGMQDFVLSHWAKAPLFVPAEDKSRFAPLLDLASFEFLLTTIATPSWLSFIGGQTMAPSRGQLTLDGTPNMSAILQAVNAKKSLLLINVHRLDAKVGALCRRLDEDFRVLGVVLGKPVRANAYFTPPQAQGLEPHYDDHDVLVLQLHGRKRWRIHNEVKWPRRPMQGPLPQEFIAPRPQELMLTPGDVLYLPRGFVHEAAAMESASLHLTLSMHAATWGDAFERLIALEDSMAEPLPVGFASGAASELSGRDKIAHLAAGLARSPAMATAMHEILNRTLTESDIPALGQLTRLETGANVEAESWLCVAPGLSAKLERQGDVPVLRVPGEAFRADPRAASFLAAISDGDPFRLCDLDNGAHAAALATLAQQLIKLGILTIEEKP